MKVALIGTGYVGLVTGVCLADVGHDVTCIDRDPAIVDSLGRGIPTIHEAGLKELLARDIAAGAIGFSSDIAAISDAGIVMLAVGTPTDPQSGETDLSAIMAALRAIAPHLRDDAVIAVKSTVPVGTNRRLAEEMGRLRPHFGGSVVSNPEFLREGTAIADFFGADRIVCGVRNENARRRMAELYRPLAARGVRLVFTTPENAELAKYASNAFLATKLAFVNEMADLCEASGANVADVAALMGMDQRIGSAFLNAGPGFGGSCFPKDIASLRTSAAQRGVSLRLVDATIAANAARKQSMADRVLAELAGPGPRRVAVLGISFKAGTDDVRESPALDVIGRLLEAGIEVHAHDPQARRAGAPELAGVRWFDRPIDATRGAAATVVMTEWPQYKAMSLAELAASMSGKLLFDMRNILSPSAARSAGLDYRCIGGGGAARGMWLSTDVPPLVPARILVAGE